MVPGTAASICDTRVDPQRDMWKMKPSGASASSTGGESTRSWSGVRSGKRRLSGRAPARLSESVKKDSASGAPAKCAQLIAGP